MRVKFAVLLTIMLLCLSGCGSAAATYTQYVQAVMDCTYHAQTSEYVRLTGVTKAEALALHEAQVKHTAELLCTQMTVKPEMLSEQTTAGYMELAETILGQMKYSVEPAVKSESAYRVAVISEPMDFWRIALGNVEQLYADNFAERFAKAEGNDKRLARLEHEWGKKVLEILTGCAEQMEYKDPVSTILLITPDADGRYSVSENTWLYLDALLLDITTQYGG